LGGLAHAPSARKQKNGAITALQSRDMSHFLHVGEAGVDLAQLAERRIAEAILAGHEGAV
jgi:HD superfamily phosphohydrolase YqeK